MTADIARDLLDDCVHCGFCLPTCPTYGPLWQQEMDSPRGRIQLMSGLVDGTRRALADDRDDTSTAASAAWHA